MWISAVTQIHVTLQQYIVTQNVYCNRGRGAHETNIRDGLR